MAKLFDTWVTTDLGLAGGAAGVHDNGDVVRCGGAGDGGHGSNHLSKKRRYGRYL